MSGTQLEDIESNEKTERTVLSTVTLSHVSQHFYVGLSVLYPDIMRDLGMNYTQLGIMTGTSSMISGFLQIVWSLLARYIPRRILLGFGNIFVSLGCIIMGSANRFVEIVGGNVVSGSGSAAQHPVGTSILAQKFPKERVAGALSIHYGLGYVGNILSPIVLSLIAVSFGWRQALYVLAIVPFLTGLSVLQFLRGDRSSLRSSQEKVKGDLWGDLKSAFHVKGAFTIIAAEAFAIGGSGMGVITVYTP
ncbi:MFS transporter, partial [Candidatus Bathyarchaeota archaeon]|nr:MFS transporter [Candidatus Bathyarchaeota archaeon]